jgi:hypothetical protein
MTKFSALKIMMWSQDETEIRIGRTQDDSHACYPHSIVNIYQRVLSWIWGASLDFAQASGSVLDVLALPWRITLNHVRACAPRVLTLLPRQYYIVVVALVAIWTAAAKRGFEDMVLASLPFWQDALTLRSLTGDDCHLEQFADHPSGVRNSSHFRQAHSYFLDENERIFKGLRKFYH